MSRSPEKRIPRRRADVFLLLRIVLIAATAAAMVKTLFMGSCGDETTTISLAMEIAGGKKLFAGTYSIHQTSAWMEALFVKLYTLLFGTVDGLQLWLRGVGIAAQILTAVCLYLALRRCLPEKLSFLLGVLTANFLPKGIQTLEYSTLHVWFEVLCFAVLVLWAMYPARARQKLLGAGFLFALAVLAYPTVIAAFPVYLGMLFLLARRMGREKPLACPVWFGLGAALALAVFLAYVQLTTGIFGANGMLANLPYLLGHFPHSSVTGSHGGGTLLARLTAFASLPTLAVLFGIACAAFAAGWAAYRTGLFKTRRTAETAAVVLLLAACAGLYLRALIFNWGACNQFTVFTCLLFTFAAAPLLYAAGPREGIDRTVLYLGWVPCWGILFGMYAGSNLVAITTQTPACMVGILTACILLWRFVQSREVSHKQLLGLGYITVLAVFLVFSRAVFTRAPGSKHYTVFDGWTRIERGVSKGVFYIPQDAQYYNELYDAIAPYEKTGDIVAANWLNLGILTQPDVIGGSPYGYTFNSTVFLASDEDPDIFFKESIAFYREQQTWPDVIVVCMWDESLWDSDYYAALKDDYTVSRTSSGDYVVLCRRAGAQEAAK